MTHYDSPTMDGSDLDYAVAEDAECHARLALDAAGVWERIEELERELRSAWAMYHATSAHRFTLQRDNERLRDDLRYLATRLRYDAPTTVYSAQRIAEWAAEQLLALAETQPSGGTAE